MGWLEEVKIENFTDIRDLLGKMLNIASQAHDEGIIDDQEFEALKARVGEARRLLDK